MKLDFDCMRDVLLTIEDKTGITERFAYQGVKFNEIAGALPQYSSQDVFYTVLKLEEAKLITVYRETGLRRAPNDFAISDITYAGHQYLNSVRDNTIWNKVKSSAKSLTISVVTQLAETFLLQNIGG